MILPFDPARSHSVVRAPGAGRGWWAGAPSALVVDETLYLAYRLRAPHPTRGYELRIGLSDDGSELRDIWAARREQFAALSLERAALVRSAERFRLYVSHVDSANGRWQIDVIEADAPDRLDPARRESVLRPEDLGIAAVKDPKILRLDGRWLMFASYTPLADTLEARVGTEETHPTQETQRGATGDAFVAGTAGSLTGLATSSDGLKWSWHGPALVPEGEGWDAYETRISTVLRTESGFLALYDGIPSLTENYEERTGLATSRDLRSWERLTRQVPALTSPEGSGSLRYADAVTFKGRVLFFYERSRADGAHDLDSAKGASGFSPA